MDMQSVWYSSPCMDNAGIHFLPNIGPAGQRTQLFGMVVNGPVEDVTAKGTFQVIQH